MGSGRQGTGVPRGARHSTAAHGSGDVDVPASSPSPFLPTRPGAQFLPDLLTWSIFVERMKAGAGFWMLMPNNAF